MGRPAHSAELRRSEIELVWGDAADFAPPEGNLVAYFFEPFEEPVTRKVIARIREGDRERDLVVVCVRPKNAMIDSTPIWDAQRFLSRAAEGERWKIYASFPTNPPNGAMATRATPHRVRETE